MQKFKTRIALLVAIAAVTPIRAQASQNPVLTAPLDGYVCQATSFEECLAAPEPTLADKVRGTLYGSQFATSSSPIVLDPKAGKVLKSDDGSRSCQYGSIPYGQQIAPGTKQELVIVPTGLLQAIGEGMIQLDHLRRSCDQAIDDYNFQVGVIKKDQDAEADAQVTAQYFSALAEWENLRLLTFPSLDKLPRLVNGQVWIGAHNWAGTHYIADAQIGLRDTITNKSKALRDDYQTAAVGPYGADKKDSTYDRQFASVQDAIDQQLRIISRYLSQLDVAAHPLPAGTVDHLLVSPGSWAQQGTPIAVIALKR